MGSTLAANEDKKKEMLEKSMKYEQAIYPNHGAKYKKKNPFH